MSRARIFVDGENWEIMGNVVDSFLPYANTLESSRSGRVFATTETKVRMLNVDDVKLEPSEFPAIAEFLETCATKRFSVTVVLDEECADGTQEFHYTNCIIEGDPQFSYFEKKITGFQVGYQDRINLNVA